MPRQIGPEMLANLDQQLHAGAIDQHTYAARRLEIEELIRKGKAFLFSPTEKALWSALAVILGLSGFLNIMSGALLPFIIGAALMALAIDRLALVLRH